MIQKMFYNVQIVKEKYFYYFNLLMIGFSIVSGVLKVRIYT